MKRIVVLLFFVAFFGNLSAQLQSFLQFQENDIVWNVNVYGEQKLKGKLGINYFFLVQDNWGEGLIGLTYPLTEYATFSVMAGMEQTPNIWRVGSFIFASKNKWNFLLNWEQGGGKRNYWYKVYLTKKVSPNLSLGFMSWRFNVTGLYAELDICKHFSIWTNVGRDLEFDQNKALVGFNIPI